eukprot:1184622-Amphidinium_carterae.1
MPLKGEKRNQRPHSVCMFGELGLLGMQEHQSPKPPQSECAIMRFRRTGGYFLKWYFLRKPLSWWESISVIAT